MCRGHGHSRCSTAQAGLVRGAAGVSRKDGLAFVPPEHNPAGQKARCGDPGHVTVQHSDDKGRDSLSSSPAPRPG